MTVEQKAQLNEIDLIQLSQFLDIVCFVHAVLLTLSKLVDNARCFDNANCLQNTRTLLASENIRGISRGEFNLTKQEDQTKPSSNIPNNKQL